MNYKEKMQSSKQELKLKKDQATEKFRLRQQFEELNQLKITYQIL